jgi:uncharacterized protein (TIGR03435 family)
MILPLAGGRTRISARLQTPADIVVMCRSHAGLPVVDRTGLQGQFDFNLDFVRGEESDSGPPSFDTPTGGENPAVAPGRGQPPALSFRAALEQQLGLRLVMKKLALDVLVLDHVNKEPTGN